MYQIRRPPGRNFFRGLSRHRVPRSLSSITDSKAQDFGCHKQKFPYSWIQLTKNSYTPGSYNKKFPVFLIPQAKISRSPDPTNKSLLYSESHTQKFPVFRIPQAKISRVPDPTRKNFPYSGSHKQQLPVVQITQAKISRILDASNKTAVFRSQKQKFPGLVESGLPCMLLKRECTSVV